MQIRPRITLLNQRPHPLGIWCILYLNLFVILASQLYWQLDPQLQETLAATKFKVISEFRWWTLIVSVFTHANLAHLLSNLLALSLYGYFVFSYLTAKIKRSAIFLAGGLLLATLLTQALSLSTYTDQIILLGASGGVFVVLGFWLANFNLIARNVSFRGRFLRSSAVALMSLIPASFEQEVSYRTHWIGFAIGNLIGLLYFYANKQRIRSFEVFPVEEAESANNLS